MQQERAHILINIGLDKSSNTSVSSEKFSKGDSAMGTPAKQSFGEVHNTWAAARIRPELKPFYMEI